MARISCFTALIGKKKSKKRIANSVDVSKGYGTLQVKLEHLSKEKASAPSSFDVPVPFEIQGNPTFKVKVMREEDSIRKEAADPAAYEGGDEHDETLSMRRDHSEGDLQARAGVDGSDIDLSMKRNDMSYESLDTDVNGRSGREDDGSEMFQNGHVSDPGMARREFWGSPALKRSCSNIEARDVLKKIGNQRSLSLRDANHFSESLNAGRVQGIQNSPMSIKTSCSADRVMLRRRSSSQVLPSRSRRLWWKLFLWSHRNLHKPPPAKSKLQSVKAPANKETGYSSDTLEPRQAQVERKNKGKEVSKWEPPGRFSAEAESSHHGRVSGLWPQSQWVAFLTDSSPVSRVEEWVMNSLEINPVLKLEDPDRDRRGEINESIDYPPSPDANESSGKPLNRLNSNLSEEVLQANNIIQSLNSFSTVAHISGMALKVIPNIAPFASLRSVNLSSNCVVQITPGLLPKSLQTLNLSRNKISVIEGLRELTRLRVLDLSYNRISRIGHGLSNCTLIKELYLAGNKISDVEGLHRLLKLAVLDLSFNKLTTTKALGQLVANYNSLLAMNLVGNPILANIGEDQLRKAVSSLLPQLAYLNKQPIGQRRAREVAMDSTIAKAALGGGGRNARRKVTKRSLQASSSSRSRVTDSAGAHSSRHNKSKSRHRS